jgi:hypothetical protein
MAGRAWTTVAVSSSTGNRRQPETLPPAAGRPARNPSARQGLSIGLVHAQLLWKTVHSHLDAPAEFGQRPQDRQSSPGRRTIPHRLGGTARGRHGRTPIHQETGA